MEQREIEIYESEFGEAYKRPFHLGREAALRARMRMTWPDWRNRGWRRASVRVFLLNLSTLYDPLQTPWYRRDWQSPWLGGMPI